MPGKVLIDGPKDAACHLIFAHGAGAAMDSPFMTKFAGLLAAESVCVHRFEFGYMAARRDGGSRRPPPKAETLTAEYGAIIEAVAASLRKGQHVFVGGKSMGGRVASLVADDFYTRGVVSGLVCVGYPFHPPAKPAQLRTAHLRDFDCPALIIQGTRDPFGTRDEVTGYELSKSIAIAWVENGDHDLKGAGRGVLETAAAAIAAFAKDRAGGRPAK